MFSSTVRIHTIAQTFEKNRKFRKSFLNRNKNGDDEDDSSAANVLNKMTGRRKPEVQALQMEIVSENHWKNLLKNEGLIVVDVYSGWAGPSVSMVNLLKKVKSEINDDSHLWLATANSDNINDLQVFRNRSEPVWLFLGGGKPVRITYGSNGPQLYEIIKIEFDKEMNCLEGKTRRKLISLKDEVKRREKAENEAIKIVKYVNNEIIKSQSQSVRGTSKENTPAPNLGIIIPEMTDFDLDQEESENMEIALKDLLRPFTILMIQSFLLDTGAVTELKGKITKKFKIFRERFIELSEEMIRKIFLIPFEIPDPNGEPEIIEPLEVDLEDAEKDGEEVENEVSEVETKVEEIVDKKDKMAVPIPQPQSRSQSRQSTARSRSKSKEPSPPLIPPSSSKEIKETTPCDGEINEENEVEDDASEKEKTPPKIRMIPVELPEELLGETLLMLVEHKGLRKNVDEGQPIFQNADDLMQDMIGPLNYEQAVEESPDSMHALYGKGEYVCGICVPQTFQDKQFVFINYFPQFITQLLTPKPVEEIRFIVAIYSVEIMSNNDFNSKLAQYKKFILAEGKLKISPEVIHDMLKSWKLHRDDLRKKEMAKIVYAVCADENNAEIFDLLKSYDPYHISYDSELGKFESAELFPKLNIQIENYERKSDYFYDNYDYNGGCGNGAIFNEDSSSSDDTNDEEIEENGLDEDHHPDQVIPKDCDFDADSESEQIPLKNG